MSNTHDAGRTTVMARSTSIAGNRSRLMKACRQVEGLFLSHLMQAMDRPAFGEGALGSSRATTLSRTQRNHAIADEMGLRGELGLAEILYNDLTNQAGAANAARSGEAAEPVAGADLR
ncbi:MAG: hypothetical protein GF393_05820 [Armatimonadia bacterium]|nr:hypothetical protein [Armatimonadia bacterium]